MSQLSQLSQLRMPGQLGRPSRGHSVCLLGLATLLLPSVGAAMEVRGGVEFPVRSQPSRSLGYTKTRIAVAAETAGSQKSPVAVYLKVKESLPIPLPTVHQEMSWSGLRLEPALVACVVDGKVLLSNQDQSPMTLLVDDRDFGEIRPGKAREYECKAGGPKQVRVKEWPHVRASIFVGEVGVVALPNEAGAFVLQAPAGTYDLQVVDADGVVTRKDVTVDKVDVDVGRLTIGSPGAGAGPK